MLIFRADRPLPAMLSLAGQAGAGRIIYKGLYQILAIHLGKLQKIDAGYMVPQQ